MLPGCADNVAFCRWSEVTRRLELWIQILEINENGDFVPVEVVPARDVRTGGIFQLRQVGIIPNLTTVNLVPAGGVSKFQLKSLLLTDCNYVQTYVLSSKRLCLSVPPPLPHLQGQSRRIQVDVRSVQDSGTMPLIAEILLAVSVGCVEIRNTTANQEGDEMDSYQVDRFNSTLSTVYLPLLISLTLTYR